MNIQEFTNPFNFSDNAVRTAIDEQNDVWFCAKDVCLALEISWSGGAKTLSNMPESWVMVSYQETIKGERETYFVKEAGVYKLIFRSNKPKAEEFANWVCEEVLPAIRKQGYFGKVSPKDYVAIVRQIAQLTGQIVASNNHFERQTLVTHLRNLHNMIGSKMPSLELIARRDDQLDWIDEAETTNG